jgi:tetratricopeptide (TPR) repeat protein
MPPFAELSNKQKTDVISLFLSLPAFWSPSEVQSVTRQLPPEMQQRIPHAPSESLLQSADNLVRTCAAYPDGFMALVKAVAYINGAGDEYKKFGDELLRLKLIEYVPEPSPIPLSERFTSNLPSPNPIFVGRETQLAQIQKTLAADEGMAVCALQGMGGVGKTMLALEYAHRHLGEYRLVAWLNAADATALNTSFSALAHALDLPEATQADYNIVRQEVLNYLTRESQWLLVYDYTEDPALLRQYLPGGSGGHILITSRNAHWHTLATKLEITTLPEVEALELLLKAANRTQWADDAETATAKTLVQELGYLPLALAQAGAFIEARQIHLAKYLEYFGKRKLELFKDAPLDYEKTVATTWNIGVEQLEKEQPKALALLNLCAFLAPEPIRFALLQEARDKLLAAEFELSEELATLLDPADDFELTEALAELGRYALATVDETSLSLHRLVALVTREKLSKDPAEYNRYAKYATFTIGKLYPNSTDYNTWEQCEELLRHAETAAEYAAAANVALDAAGYLYNQTGLYLKGRAQYSAARQNYERAVAIVERDLGKEHPEVATRYNNLGRLLQDMGDLLTAKSYLEHAIAIDERIYGIDHPEVANDYNNLGGLLQAMGDLPAAKSYYEQATAIREKVYGLEHPDTAQSYNNLGGLLQDIGDLPTAKSYYEQAIAIGEKTLGKEHPDVATRYNNLGKLLQAMGDLLAAKSYLERAVAIKEKVYGLEHPEVATSYNNLGGLLQAMGDFSAAKSYYERGLAIVEKVLGENHPYTASSYNNLGSLLKDMGDLLPAKSYYERATAIDERIYGSEHPTVALRYNNYGLLLYEMDERAGAREYLRRALAIFQAKLGEQHPNTQQVAEDLAYIESSMGE